MKTVQQIKKLTTTEEIGVKLIMQELEPASSIEAQKRLGQLAKDHKEPLQPHLQMSSELQKTLATAGEIDDEIWRKRYKRKEFNPYKE